MTLSAAVHERIRAEIAHYPNPRGALLFALHQARDELGRLTREAYAEIGGLFGLREGEVAEVASFYSLFTQPSARAVFQVCTNLPCCLRGARGIVELLEQKIGAKAGTSSPDGRFAVTEVECLGSCGTAPVVQVNRNPFLENVTPEFIASLTSSPE